MSAPDSTRVVDMIVIGAGLSGLTAAHLLSKAGRSVHLLEARSFAGGRIRSIVDPNSDQYRGDLGPTWVWPKYQPVVREWIDRLGIETFAQYESGGAVFDGGPGKLRQIVSLPGQEGIERIVGGPQAFIDRLLTLVPTGTFFPDTVVTRVSKTSDGLLLVHSADGQYVHRAKHVVCAIPARLAGSTIQWEPALEPAFDQVLRHTPTWMAPQAKVVAVYQHAFWREQGLSGRIASQTGPLVEAHDHCGVSGTPAAIFGFVGWPPALRQERADTLEQDIRDQLIRCFGTDNPTPTKILIQDWATEQFTANEQDINGPISHPGPTPDVARKPHADGGLWFVGAELALVSPGLIEGALDSAQRTVEVMLA